MALFDDIFDRLVLHQVRTIQVSIGLYNAAAAELDKSESDVEAILASLASYLERRGGLRVGDTQATSYIDNQVQKIGAVRRTAYARAEKVLQGAVDDLVEYETQFFKAVMRPAGNVSIARINGAANTPIQGHTLDKWRTRLLDNDLNRLNQALRLGVRIGDNETRLRQALLGQKSLRGVGGATMRSRNELEALVRTFVDSVTEVPRAQAAIENAFLNKEVYVAILDGRTSSICRGLHGSVFGSLEGPRPPVHFYCRSTRVPLVGDAKPNIPSFPDWLGRLTSAEQNEVIGPRQASLFRSGQLSMEQFNEPAWRGIGIPTMARRERRVFEDAGLDVPFQ